jgi:uncharacterized protein YrzB (UPF0473 family)
MSDNTIVITKADGTEITCEILFTFHSDETEKDYVLYVEVDDEEGNVFASSYTEEADGMIGELFDIPEENEEEWQMIEEVLNAFQSE